MVLARASTERGVRGAEPGRAVRVVSGADGASAMARRPRPPAARRRGTGAARGRPGRAARAGAERGRAGRGAAGRAQTSAPVAGESDGPSPRPRGRLARFPTSGAARESITRPAKEARGPRPSRGCGGPTAGRRRRLDELVNVLQRGESPGRQRTFAARSVAAGSDRHHPRRTHQGWRRLRGSRPRHDHALPVIRPRSNATGLGTDPRGPRPRLDPRAGSSATRRVCWASHGSTASPTEATTSRRDPIPPRFAHYGVEGSSMKRIIALLINTSLGGRRRAPASRRRRTCCAVTPVAPASGWRPCLRSAQRGGAGARRPRPGAVGVRLSLVGGRWCRRAQRGDRSGVEWGVAGG